MNTGFQILDKGGTPILINELDREICELLNKEYDDKYYCGLAFQREGERDLDFAFRDRNWFDTIGFLIASENKSFEEIKEVFSKPMEEFLGKVDEKGNVITIESIYPGEMAVLNNWIAKGYTPKQVTLY